MTATTDWYDRHYGSDFSEASPWYAAALGWLQREPRTGSLIELGCGRAKLLAQLAHAGAFPPQNLYGIEQSAVAIAPAREFLTNVNVGNIEDRLPFEDGTFDYVVMTEVIEHLVRPWEAMHEIRRILKPGGKFLLSFPNYTNLPWLAVRVLSELVDRPNWIVLQPIDHMWLFSTVSGKLKDAGFGVDEVIGNVYFPPILYRWEPKAVDRALTAAKLGGLSFHPVVVCGAR